MTTGAIVMMLVAMTFLWGVLVLALLNIIRNRPTPSGEPFPATGVEPRSG